MSTHLCKFRIDILRLDFLRGNLFDCKSFVLAKGNVGFDGYEYGKSYTLVIHLDGLVVDLRTSNGFNLLIFIQKLVVVFLSAKIKSVLEEQTFAVSVFKYVFGDMTLAEAGHVVLALVLLVGAHVEGRPFGVVHLKSDRQCVLFSFLRIFHCFPPKR